MRKFIPIFLLVLFSFFSTLSAQSFTLHILHNNDGESQLIDAGSGAENFGGIARFKSLVDKLRSTAASVMLSSGDNFLPGPEFNASLSLPEGDPIYDAIALDKINYDAICIGNHDFDFGPDILERFINSFSENKTPFLSSNLDFSNEPGLNSLVNSGRIASSTVVNIKGQNIGIVGATTEELSNISSPRNVIINDVKKAIQTEVDALTADGIEIIIVISHLQSITEDKELAAQLKDVDVMIAGGGDEILANDDDLLVPGDEIADSYPVVVKDADDNDVYVVTTAGNYKYVGRLIVGFDSDGKVVTVDEDSGPVRVANRNETGGVFDDAEIQSLVVDPVEASVADLAANIIATSEVGLNGVRAEVRTKETNLGNLVADAMLWQANQKASEFGLPNADVALQNGGSIRNDNVIPAGDISELNTFDILPFSNFVTIIPSISPEQFKEILENCVSRIESVSGRFAQVSGFKLYYTLDGTPQVLDDDENVVTPGSRIIKAELNDGTVIIDKGQIVEDAPDINIAIVDFLARGGDQYPFRGAEFTSVGVSYQQALANYIVDGLNGTVAAVDYPEGGESRINPSETYSLTILHNNDAESQLINAGSGLEDFGGVARFKTLADNLKEEAENNGASWLMLTSGDNYLPGPEFNASIELPESEPLFDAVAISKIGYDALCIGNHEFDFGPDILERLIEGGTESGAVFLSSNLDFTGEPGLNTLFNSGKIAKSIVVEKDGEEIGVVGATTPDLPFVSSPRNVVVDSNVKEAIQNEIDAMVANGVNKIVVISHLQSVNEDLELVAELKNVDVMIAGGGGEVLANEGDLLVPSDSGEVFDSYPIVVKDADDRDVYVVTTAGDFKYLGMLKVGFDANGEIVNVSSDSRPVRVAGGTLPDAVEEDADMKTSVVDPVSASIEALAQNVIATSEVGLNGIRADVRSQETNLGNLVADAMLWQANEKASDFSLPNADVALQNGGSIRNNNVIAAGNITELNTFDILPFSNFVTIIQDIPADHFKEILENAVSKVESGSGRFAQVSGFTFVYDPAGTPQELDGDANVVAAGTRVVSAQLNDGTVIIENGAPVNNAPTVNIAIVDFLARGGDQYPFRGAEFASVGVSYQQALANYIVDGLSGTVAAADYPEGGEGRITTGVVTDVNDANELPNVYALEQNYPNPFNPSTTIQFSLPEVNFVNVKVYNVLGEVVTDLISEELPAGYHQIKFDASYLSSGIYFYQIQAGNFNQVKKMMLIK